MSGNDLLKHVQETQLAFDQANRAVKTSDELEELRVGYLGRKGRVAELFKSLSTLPPESRKAAGQALNQLKETLQAAFDEKKAKMQRQNESASSCFDLTLPGNWPDTGRLHPLTQVTREIKQIFQNMGYRVADGPEVRIGVLQLRSPEHPPRPSSPGHAGYVVHQRGHGTSDPYLTGPGPNHGVAVATHSRDLTGALLSPGHARCLSFAHGFTRSRGSASMRGSPLRI